MIISSAYVFGKQISAGQVPVADNIIFENGAFNMNRMESGFDFTQNIQRTPQEWGISTGMSAIEGGYMTPYYGTGAIFAAYGTERTEDYFLEDGTITGIGRSRSGGPCSISYYLPVTMRTLREEGYTMMKAIVSGNAAGMPNAGPNDYGGGANIGVLRMFETRMNSWGSADSGALGQGIEEEEEKEITVDLSNSMDLDYAPAYIRLNSMGGTTRFKKIWFA